MTHRVLDPVQVAAKCQKNVLALFRNFIIVIKSALHCKMQHVIRDATPTEANLEENLSVCQMPKTKIWTSDAHLKEWVNHCYHFYSNMSTLIAFPDIYFLPDFHLLHGHSSICCSENSTFYHQPFVLLSDLFFL